MKKELAAFYVKVCSAFFLKNFIVSVLLFRPLIYLKFIFVYVRKSSNCILIFIAKESAQCPPQWLFPISIPSIGIGGFPLLYTLSSSGWFFSVLPFPTGKHSRPATPDSMTSPDRQQTTAASPALMAWLLPLESQLPPDDPCCRMHQCHFSRVPPLPSGPGSWVLVPSLPFIPPALEAAENFCSCQSMDHYIGYFLPVLLLTSHD